MLYNALKYFFVCFRYFPEKFYQTGFLYGAFHRKIPTKPKKRSTQKQGKRKRGYPFETAPSFFYNPAFTFTLKRPALLLPLLWRP
jgi:hypothetical protein